MPKFTPDEFDACCDDVGNSYHSELTLLAYLIKEPAAFEDIRDDILPENFSYIRMSTIFIIMEYLWDDYRWFDVPSIHDAITNYVGIILLWDTEFKDTHHLRLALKEWKQNAIDALYYLDNLTLPANFNFKLHLHLIIDNYKS